MTFSNGLPHGNMPMLTDQQRLGYISSVWTGCCLEDWQEAMDDRYRWQNLMMTKYWVSLGTNFYFANMLYSDIIVNVIIHLWLLNVRNPVTLELWGMQSIPFLPSFPGPLWPGRVTSDKDLSVSQTELNCVFMLN